MPKYLCNYKDCPFKDKTIQTTKFIGRALMYHDVCLKSMRACREFELIEEVKHVFDDNNYYEDIMKTL